MAKTNWGPNDTVQPDDMNQIGQEINDNGTNIQTVADNLAAHEADNANPHNVTKGQVGLGNVDNVKQASKTEFDNHVGNTSNPHGVTKSQVGLGSVENYAIATKAQAEAGTVTNRYMTPLRVKEAIEALAPQSDKWELITHTVFSVAAPATEFTGIATHFRRFKLRFKALSSTNTQAHTSIFLRINNTSTGQFNYQYGFVGLWLNNSTVRAHNSGGDAQIDIPYAGGGLSSGGGWSFTDIIIENPDASSAPSFFIETISPHYPSYFTGGGNYGFNVKISSMQITRAGGNFAVGSEFTLWGER